MDGVDVMVQLRKHNTETLLTSYRVGSINSVDARTKYDSYLEHKFLMLPRMNGYKLKAYLLFI